MRRDGLLEHERGHLQAPDRRTSGARSGERVAGGVEALLVWNNEGVVEMTQSLPELQAEAGRIHWLHGALNEIARVRAEEGNAQAFRFMQARAMVVGQRRIELSMRIAELERVDG